MNGIEQQGSKGPRDEKKRGPRIAREQQTIEAMLHIYCRDHHSGGQVLCEECIGLLRYARQRLDNCPFGEQKPACNHCEVHCYASEMRNRVKSVMRYAGPRMLLRHPLLSLRHLLDTRRPVPVLKSRRSRDP